MRTNTAAVKKYNPKKLQFFEAKRFGPKGEALDPWGTPYQIIIDADSNHVVAVGDTMVHDAVAVWSFGKNRRNEWGQGDDIVSWSRESGR